MASLDCMLYFLLKPLTEVWATRQKRSQCGFHCLPIKLSISRIFSQTGCCKQIYMKLCGLQIYTVLGWKTSPKDIDSK